MRPDLVRNSIIIYAITGLIGAMVIQIILFSIYPHARQLGRRFRASISPRQRPRVPVLPHSTMSSVRARLSNPMHRNRIGFLLLAALGMILESANGIALMVQLGSDRPDRTNWVIYESLRPIGALLAGICYTIAMSYRIIVLVSHDPAWQVRFMRVISLALFCTLFPILVTLSLETHRLSSRNAPLQEWMVGNFIPSSVTAVIGIAPALTVAGSVWSLRLATNHLSMKKTSTATSRPDALADHFYLPKLLLPSPPSIASGSSARHSTAMPPSLSIPDYGAAFTLAAVAANRSFTAEQEDPPSTAPPIDLSKVCADTTTTVTPLPGPPASPKLSLPRRALNSMHAVAVPHRLPEQSIMYPLTRAFLLLSAINLVLWIAFSAVLVYHLDFPFVRNTAVADLILSLAVLDEALFSWVLRSSAQSHSRTLQRRKSDLVINP
ncbi:hypothetical protein BC828DRAFT_376878 [Blastocladiella britannica]|nr:hypothetical protein BC828DRAFT_376878 [Blastocladiella britannica]